MSQNNAIPEGTTIGNLNYEFISNEIWLIFQCFKMFVFAMIRVHQKLLNYTAINLYSEKKMYNTYKNNFKERKVMEYHISINH